MNFRQLFSEIVSSNGRVLLTEKAEQKLERPFIQYQKTDWEYIKEVAKTLGLPVMPVCSSITSDLIIGFQRGTPEELGGIYKRKTVKYLENMRKERGVRESDCICLEVETYEYHELGSRVLADGREWIIGRARLRTKNSLISHEYLLVQECNLSILGIAAMKRGKETVSRCAAALTGTVLSCHGNTVKVHLDIDSEQREEEAYPYEYFPISGNIMYSMPEKGSRVVLTVTEHFPGGGIVTDCLPGQAGKRDHKKKTIRTGYGKYLSLGARNILLGDENAGVLQRAVIEDNREINIASPLPIIWEADKEIQIFCDGAVNINSLIWLDIAQGGTSNEILMSGNEIVHKAVRHSYSAGEQRTRQLEKPAEDSYFSSMDLADVVLGILQESPSDPVSKAIMGAQPVACSPDRRKWKNTGTGFHAG